MPFDKTMEAWAPSTELVTASDHTGDAIEVRTVLHEMLASEVFCKALRLCRLMRFLVDMALQGRPDELCEYAIGIAVFDRDGNNYHTGEDPVVRVQVGRLREKLKAYYENFGAKSKLRISIPIGTYIPVISRVKIMDSDFLHRYMLAMSPLKCITPDAGGSGFTQGLTEELSHQLFGLFGSNIVSHTIAYSHGGAGDDPVKKAGVSHLLEGSVRVEGAHVRLAIRLLDAKAGGIVWSELFDRDIELSLASQHELARTVCDALQRYFSEG